jgi:hypothetical protein
VGSGKAPVGTGMQHATCNKGIQHEQRKSREVFSLGYRYRYLEHAQHDTGRLPVGFA